VVWLRPGNEAEVILDGSDKLLRGHVDWVGFEADPSTGKFKLEIHIPNADLALRSGVVGRARVLKKDHGQVLAIPRDCVLGAGVEDHVFVVQGDTAAIQPVTLGADQGLMVIVESGLQVGDMIVVRGQRELVEGAHVTIQQTASASDGSAAGDPAVIRTQPSRVSPRQDQEGGE
jgi:membrane fusion protein (multidrug efflux system)/multidrug efflux system membrane fusion protein/cobalt-zinc-cadmium efflux system membrane fusion protein